MNKISMLLTTAMLVGESVLLFPIPAGQTGATGQSGAGATPVNQATGAQQAGAQQPGAQAPNSQTPGTQSPGTQAPGSQTNNTAANTASQLGTTRSYGTVGRSPWFQNPQVRRDLNLNETQYNSLNDQYRQLYGRYRQDLSALDQRRLAPDQRQMQRRNLNQRFYQDFSTATDQIIQDEAARSRYRQLGLQYRGYGALSDPAVQQSLNLTDNQRQRIDQLQEYWNDRMRRIDDGYGSDRDRSNADYQALQQNMRTQLNDVLNDQQRQQWTNMIGDPYDFPADTYFGGNRNRSQTPGNRNNRANGNNGVNPNRNGGTGTGTGGTGTP